MENARLTAVCDNNPQSLIPFKVKSGITVYDNYDSFLKDSEVDAVIICTPSGLHTEMGVKAAQAGKHILMEKPFVLDDNQGQELVDLCKAKGVKLGVVHPNRAKAVVQALHEAVDGGWFGKITHASAVLRWNRSPEYYNAASWRGTRKLDGGILYNQAIHNIDLLNWLLGPVGEVSAYSATQLRPIEYEDVCVCALKFKSGALGVIEAAVTIYPENLEESIAIFGSDGTAVLGGRSLSKVQEWKFSRFAETENNSQAERLNTLPNSAGHREILEDFVEAISLNREPLVSGEEAMKVLNLINAIYQSASTGLPVKITSDQVNKNE